MNRPSQGFTFIEVLVALAIFALAGVALASACVNFLAAQHAAYRRDARALDRELVRRALGSEPERKKAEDWNECLLPGNRSARWRARITPTPVADLFEVVLEGELPAEGDKLQGNFLEDLRLLRPTWSEPAERAALRAAARARLAQRTP